MFLWVGVVWSVGGVVFDAALQSRTLALACQAVWCCDLCVRVAVAPANPMSLYCPCLLSCAHAAVTSLCCALAGVHFISCTPPYYIPCILPVPVRQPCDAQ